MATSLEQQVQELSDEVARKIAEHDGKGLELQRIFNTYHLTKIEREAVGTAVVWADRILNPSQDIDVDHQFVEANMWLDYLDIPLGMSANTRQALSEAMQPIARQLAEKFPQSTIGRI